MKYIDYKDLEDGLEKIPVTWYPAIILHIIEVAHKRNVFKPYGASRMIRKFEKRLKNEKNKNKH